MMPRRVVAAGLLLTLLLVLLACTGSSQDEGIPPCTPADGSDANLCAQDISQITVGDSRGSGPSLGRGTPRPVRWFLDSRSGLLAGHLVVRGLYKPSTVRCVDTKVQRHHGYTTLDDLELPTGIGLLKCYADLQVNDYIVGSGPLTIPVVALFIRYWDRDATAEQIAALRADAERVLIEGGEHRFIREHGFIRDVPEGGITNVESIIFLGPEMDASVEGWEVFTTWNMERKEDGTVMVIHPHAFWWQDAPNVATEWTLGEFTTAAQTAHAARLSDYAGRIGEETNLPQLVTNANNLHSFHVETGNTTHPDGPPETSLPPACGLAVPNQASNPGLMRDCLALLEGKDTLRGTGTLNWSVDTTIADWDGITTGGTPSRVTKVEVDDEDLTGSIPSALAKLELTTLKLAGNSLTGCIPVALRDVPQHDLDRLGLPDCAPP